MDRCRWSRSCRCEEKSFSPDSVCDRVVCDSLAPFRFTVQYIVSSPSLKLHPSFPSLSAHRAPDLSRALTRGLSSVYLPLSWKTPRPIPPIWKHLPIDAVAYKNIPFTLGVSQMPMINSHLVSPSPGLPPQWIMNATYSVLKKRVREALLKESANLYPTPGYYHHLPELNPRPFMGLGKFIAGRIHQIRAGQSYLAADPTCKSPCADTSCPRCGLDPETFEHAILSCPSRQGARSRLLHGVSGVGPGDPVGPPCPSSEGWRPLSASPPRGSHPRCSPPPPPLPPPGFFSLPPGFPRRSFVFFR